MGLRGNTLLNFKPVVANTLAIIDEKAREVFRLLVVEQKSMAFIPAPTSMEDESNPQTLPKILEDENAARRHTDNRLRTKLSADELDKRLLKIRTVAESYYQEHGVDLLYLALGFLIWYEDKSSSTPRKAPLVLVPVSLERKRAGAPYKVEYTKTDLGPNLTLAYKLKSEFEIRLPDFKEELELDGYDKYLKEVVDSVAHKTRWQVQADEIALGFFSFGKFQMYQDLDPENWPEGRKPYDHKVLQKLLTNGFGESVEKPSRRWLA